MKIILASASPRRAQLLQQLGLEFEIIAADVNEDITAVSPQDLAMELAFRKAERIADLYPDRVVIAADTIVVIDNLVLGKPSDADDARTMLHRLSGRKHQVITGVSLHCKELNYAKTESEITAVEFRSLTDEEVESYIRTGEPFDKAGAYGIQGLGALLVNGIEGCYFNVVGLPLNRLGQMLRDVGINILGG